MVHLGDVDVPNAFMYVSRAWSAARLPPCTLPSSRCPFAYRYVSYAHRDHSLTRSLYNSLLASTRSYINKYTQVTTILSPIVRVLDSLDEIAAEDEGIADLICGEFGSVERCRKVILRDFFRHGFDGSGDDGGSCIDGRLTSAWNWTEKIEKKNYFPIFLLAGFVGFDGDFRR